MIHPLPKQQLHVVLPFLFHKRNLNQTSKDETLRERWDLERRLDSCLEGKEKEGWKTWEEEKGGEPAGEEKE